MEFKGEQMSVYPKELRKHLEGLVEYWKPRLLLHHYDISFKYSEPLKKEESNVDASIHVNDVYLQGTITVFPIMANDWKIKNYKDIENTIVHEMCHIMTTDFSFLAEKFSPEMFHEKLDEANETLVQTMTNIFIVNKSKGLRQKPCG